MKKNQLASYGLLTLMFLVVSCDKDNGPVIKDPNNKDPESTSALFVELQEHKTWDYTNKAGGVMTVKYSDNTSSKADLPNEGENGKVYQYTFETDASANTVSIIYVEDIPKTVFKMNGLIGETGWLPLNEETFKDFDNKEVDCKNVSFVNKKIQFSEELDTFIMGSTIRTDIVGAGCKQYLTDVYSVVENFPGEEYPQPIKSYHEQGAVNEAKFSLIIRLEANIGTEEGYQIP